MGVLAPDGCGALWLSPLQSRLCQAPHLFNVDGHDQVGLAAAWAAAGAAQREARGVRLGLVQAEGQQPAQLRRAVDAQRALACKMCES